MGGETSGQQPTDSCGGLGRNCQIKCRFLHINLARRFHFVRGDLAVVIAVHLDEHAFRVTDRLFVSYNSVAITIDLFGVNQNPRLPKPILRKRLEKRRVTRVTPLGCLRDAKVAGSNPVAPFRETRSLTIGVRCGIPVYSKAHQPLAWGAIIRPLKDKYIMMSTVYSSQSGRWRRTGTRGTDTLS